MKNILPAFVFIAMNLSSPGQSVNWASNISCILYSHCTSCHNPSGIAPFSLLTYTDAAFTAAAIITQVQNRRMPPYLADVGYQQYAHQKTLTQDEINLITAWVNDGAPAGDTTLAPAPPTYTGGSVFTNPDFSSAIPTYTIPSLSNDMYRCFIISNPFVTDQYITAMEVIPGNRAAVHHVLVYSDPSNTPVALDLADPEPGYVSFGGTGSASSELIGGYVPGSDPYYLPQGMGMKVAAGSRIIIQVHYPFSASGLTDSTRINFLFSGGAVRTATDVPVLNHHTTLIDGPLFIPADSVKTFHAVYTIPIDVSMLSITPHAHLICSAMSSMAVLPSGDTIPLVKIDNWDFHWQGAYYFQKPIHLPPGTVLYGEATYDNTVNNPQNPNNPPQDVSLGESTTDEMMLFYFVYLDYVAGDENIVVDTTSHIAHYLNCVSAPSLVAETSSDDYYNVYPNPAYGFFILDASYPEPHDITIHDAMGKTVFELKNISRTCTINSEPFAAGIYFIAATTGKNIISRKKIIITD